LPNEYFKTFSQPILKLMFLINDSVLSLKEKTTPLVVLLSDFPQILNILYE